MPKMYKNRTPKDMMAMCETPKSKPKSKPKQKQKSAQDMMEEKSEIVPKKYI